MAINEDDIYGYLLFQVIKDTVFDYLAEYYHYFEETIDAHEEDFDKEDYSPYKTLNSHISYILKYAEENIGEYVIKNHPVHIPIEEMMNWLNSWQFNGDDEEPVSIVKQFIYYHILIIEPQLFITELREIKTVRSLKNLK